MKSPLLPINNMSDQHIGLTPALSETYLEAARVCLDRHHVSPQEFLLKKEPSQKNVLIEWEEADERCRAAWGNLHDAVRDGAYACAIAAAELFLGLFAVRRAETLTGADYYISPLNNKSDDLEDCWRLEVSGSMMGFGEVKKKT